MSFTATIDASSLEYSFTGSGNSVRVLRSVSLQAFPGQITSVVGPSGCGKSTLLYLLGLLDIPDSGEVRIDGKSMSRATDRERTEMRNLAIGFVFQFHFLIKELSVLENVCLPGLKAGKCLSEVNASAKKVLGNLDLLKKIDRPAHSLSGGEQQRVAIARALANSPKVILADEPTGNLDSGNSAAVFDILKEFARDEGLAVVMVTHNQELANRSDQIIEMMDGRIVS